MYPSCPEMSKRWVTALRSAGSRRRCGLTASAWATASCFLRFSMIAESASMIASPSFFLPVLRGWDHLLLSR